MEQKVIPAFKQVKIHRRSYDKIVKIFQCMVIDCGRSYAQFPQLFQHYKTKHPNIEMSEHPQRPKKNEKSSKKGRPQSKVVETKQEEIIRFDSYFEKMRTITLYENKDFCSMLVNLMFTSGYLSRNLEEDQEEGDDQNIKLNSQQIMELFSQLQKIFNCHCKLRLSKFLLDALIFISTIVYDAAFIVIFYCLFIGEEFQSLYRISQLHSENDKKFYFICQLIRQETVDAHHETQLQNYFCELSAALIALNQLE